MPVFSFSHARRADIRLSSHNLVVRHVPRIDDALLYSYNSVVFGMFAQFTEAFRPHHRVHRLEELDCAMLAARGVQGVMLDLDNTIAPYRRQDISPAVEAWMEQLHRMGLRGCMVTNAATVNRVRPVAERLGIPWVARANKPFRGGFQRGMHLLGTTPATTAMVGDLLTMDIIGGNRLGLFTVLVEPMCPREAWGTRFFQRPVERWLRNMI